MQKASTSALQSPVHQPKAADVGKYQKELQMTLLAIQTSLTALQTSQEAMLIQQENISVEQRPRLSKLDNSIKEVLVDVQFKAEQNTQKIQKAYEKLETVDKETQLLKLIIKLSWDLLVILEREKVSRYLREAMFRWLSTEGMSLSWNVTGYKPDSIIKAQELNEKFRSMSEEEGLGASKEGGIGAELTTYHSEEGEIVNTDLQQEVQTLEMDTDLQQALQILKAKEERWGRGVKKKQENLLF